ncbi:amino acid adenylation domain-containing protein [Neolewinella xylanilytica]|uniref:Amino acid adenylation domain-containing protein n=2 Tax=Neolewinella xylanilytica TaxID=1514080 RepID=A0A2S6I2F9_9BACT|nr:amino acid adenylation domain-containing protein [Neolewinella xylanilytica]
MHYLLFHPIDRHAAASPDRTAFRCGKQAITYAELAERTNRLAHLLLAQGVQRGDRIGIYLPRSLDGAAAVHGILKAGAAYVPLDPEAPVARTRRLIDDCGIKVVFVAPALRRNFTALFAAPSPVNRVVGGDVEGVISLEWDALADYPATAPDLRILGDDLAYVMYTSGSTGEPKGIMHTHTSGLAYARLSRDLYNVQPDDVIGNHCALHYDISTFGYFTGPLAGATTVIVTDAHTKFPTSLLQLVEQERITIWYSVPLALLQMLRSPTLGERDLSALRWVLFGGEVFAPRHLRALMEHAPNARASNVYGPAEVNQCTYFHLAEAPDTDDPLPLGHVWNDTETLILDPDDGEVAEGEIGELLVRSATRMKGYWNRADLTARGFYYRERIPGNRETFYRTGDLVYRDADGLLQFMGRKDRQVKIRGHRVELEEVEAVLAAQPGVGEAAVYLREIGDNEKVIEALVVAESDWVGNPRTWIIAMGDQLPPHAVPVRIDLLPNLPRNDAGKIDRLAIREAITKSMP